MDRKDRDAFAAAVALRRAGVVAVALLGLCLFAAALAAESERVPEQRPEAAEAALAKGREAYQSGDYAAALQAFQDAEAAGARFGLLFYQMAYCQVSLGDKKAQRQLLARAVPYFEAEVQSGGAGVDSYYYLAAIYFQELPDRVKAAEVVQKAIQADAAGTLGEDLDGDALFRLGRIYSFALEFEPPGGSERRAELEKSRLESYYNAAEKLLRTRNANQVYLGLALEDVAQAAMRDRRWADAIDAYSKASASDPLEPGPGTALLRLGRDLSARGDREGALKAWQGVRGPDGPKTQANYGLRLMRRILAHGDLPVLFEGRPLASLEAAALVSGILEAAGFLKTVMAGDEMAVGGFSADPEEVRRQEGVFLALTITYFERGNDLRTFAIQHQLVPLIFGQR